MYGLGIRLVFKNRGTKSAIRRYGPAKVLYIQNSQAYILYAGRIPHVPSRFLKVYNPDTLASEGQQHGEGVGVGGLIPRNFRDAITMDISAPQMSLSQ